MNQVAPIEAGEAGAAPVTKIDVQQTATPL
jgi:hypothetical protein